MWPSFFLLSGQWHQDWSSAFPSEPEHALRQSGRVLVRRVLLSLLVYNRRKREEGRKKARNYYYYYQQQQHLCCKEKELTRRIEDKEVFFLVSPIFPLQQAQRQINTERESKIRETNAVFFRLKCDPNLFFFSLPPSFSSRDWYDKERKNMNDYYTKRTQHNHTPLFSLFSF